MSDLIKYILNIFADNLYINKNIDIRDNINEYFYENSHNKCSHYITKGKYKNTICTKLEYKETLCKVHYKYIDKNKKKKDIDDYLDKNIIELHEIEFNNTLILISNNNIVYEKFEKGYFPVGEYNPNTKKLKKN